MKFHGEQKGDKKEAMKEIDISGMTWSTGDVQGAHTEAGGKREKTRVEDEGKNVFWEGGERVWMDKEDQGLDSVQWLE